MVELLSGTLDSTSGAATPANRDNWHNGNDFGSFIFQAAIGIAPSTSESATMRISIRDTVTQALYAVCEWTITATDT
jgi:hypothetical protein